MTRFRMSVKTVMLASLMTAAGVAAAAAPSGMQGYRALAISAGGERIAAIEALDPGGLPQRPHGVIRVRDAASGRVLASYDPCATCNYDFPSWSPQRNALAFIGADAKAGTPRCMSRPTARWP